VVSVFSVSPSAENDFLARDVTSFGLSLCPYARVGGPSAPLPAERHSKNGACSSNFVLV